MTDATFPCSCCHEPQPAALLRVAFHGMRHRRGVVAYECADREACAARVGARQAARPSDAAYVAEAGTRPVICVACGHRDPAEVLPVRLIAGTVMPSRCIDRDACVRRRFAPRPRRAVRS